MSQKGTCAYSEVEKKKEKKTCLTFQEEIADVTNVVQTIVAKENTIADQKNQYANQFVSM